MLDAWDLLLQQKQAAVPYRDTRHLSIHEAAVLWWIQYTSVFLQTADTSTALPPCLSVMTTCSTRSAILGFPKESLPFT